MKNYPLDSEAFHPLDGEHTQVFFLFVCCFLFFSLCLSFGGSALVLYLGCVVKKQRSVNELMLTLNLPRG